MNTNQADALYDPAPVERARERHGAVCARQTENITALTTAVQAVRNAVHARETLLRRDASGADVSARERAAADSAVTACEAELAYRRELAGHLDAEARASSDAIAEAQHEAAAPIARAGARARLLAARRLDEARAALELAERDYDAGSAILAHAVQRGFRVRQNHTPGPVALGVADVQRTRPQRLGFDAADAGGRNWGGVRWRLIIQPPSSAAGSGKG